MADRNWLSAMWDDNFKRRDKRMKRLLISALLPLLLSQGVAIAQTTPQNLAEPEERSVSQPETVVNQQE